MSIEPRAPRGFKQWKHEEPKATITPAIINLTNELDRQDWYETIEYVERYAWYQSRNNLLRELIQDGVIDPGRAEEYFTE